MNEWLESLFYRLYFSIERPYLSFEAEASFNIDFVFVIKEYHAFSNVAASFSEPLCADLWKMDEYRADLSCFHNLNWHSVWMDALDIDHTEPSFSVWPDQGPLVLLEFTLVNYTLQNQFLIGFLVSLGDMEFSSVCLLLQSVFHFRELQIIQKVFEKLNSLFRFIWNRKDRTHYLWLHLSIDEDDILFIVNDIAYFLSDVPYLRSQFIDHVIQDLRIFDAIYFG